ncbi:Trk-type K+ transport system, membrane component [Desulfocapsa sulfexigens DSM 10523]|uniref:Trk-type K+ transport system, membrane component n=1 Tax=Desulfocapsa sulfexigens (strain DSM 10523 / SB164P1) TaxID=1167006 RepID=M1P241_DESSD|nr:potassium transporter TrkG [Desulfocapsa sulfexigens]AGF77543.1 Trk-type K+ transport system, membrane component [Desulfocapsa sulfexigens DSM 10523]
MVQQATELRYAVRFRVVCKYFGQMSLVLATLSLAPFVVSVICGDIDISLRYGVVICGLAVLGASLSRLRTPARVQANEGMMLVALIFFFTPLVMSYPMMGSGLGFFDAFFEAVSGVTTTGLSTKATLVGAPPTFLFARAWMQWYGGLGIVVLSLALVIQPGLDAKGLAVTEAESDDLVGGTRAHARRVLKVYIILTVLGIIGSLAVGMRCFDGVLYTFAAVSTGGFAPNDTSLAILGWPAQVWISLLCLAGAIPLAFWYGMFKEKWRVGVEFLQMRAIIIVILIVSLTIGAAMRLSTDMAWTQILHHAPLLAFSAQTTAGFSSISCDQLDAGSKLVLISSMLVGGGFGSTSGGFKLLRLLIAVSVLRLILVRTCLPRHAVIEHRLVGRRLRDQDIHAALLLIVLFVAVVLFSWLPFVVMGFSPLDSLFEVVSATGTVGLSVGLTNANLPALLKGVLCVDMLMGRLEIIAWLMMIYPGTWFGRRMEET